MGRNSCHYCVAWNVFGDYGASGHNTMASNGDTRQDDSIGTYPHIVANDNGLGRYALLVDATRKIFEIMVECRNGDALCQIYMVANANGTNDGGVDADAGMVANNDVTNGIVDAAIGLYYAPFA